MATSSQNKRNKAKQAKAQQGERSRRREHKHPNVFAWIGAKRWRVAIASVLAVACVVYVCGVALFSHVFMPNTRLGGRDISLMSVDDVANNLDLRNDAYMLEVSGDSFSLSIPAESVDLTLNGIACAQKTIAQTNPWGWPVSMFLEHNLELSKESIFDETLATTLVQDAVNTFNQTAIPPTPARIDYQSSTGSFEVTPQVEGTQLDEAKVQDAVMQALTAFQTQLVLDENDLLGSDQNVSVQQLSQACFSANNMLNLTASITAGGDVVKTVSVDDLAGWITFAEDFTPSFDASAISAWTEKSLTGVLNTVGAQRTYTRPDGKTITVKGGTYGWKANVSGVASKLYDALSQGKPASVEVSYSQKAAQIPDAGGQDFGNTYIDIDIAEQHARYYQDGEVVWESDIISGNPNTGHATPEGVFYINNNFNKSNTASTLRGKIDPATGQPEYESKVQYWMPFYNNAVGLHDADWQSSFGGKSYLTRGSHGCVNLPPEKAKELVSLIDRGLVVVVHE